MLEEVISALSTFNLQPDKPIIVGVSGGADSLCLLDILHRAGLSVIVAHFNHKLRSEADQEAAVVASLARSLDLPFVSDSAGVREYAEAENLSLEEAARTLRYRFLFAAARAHNAQAVAVGHTADDQVETVLMHFVRGAGLSGLKGMSTRTILPVFDASIPVIRPLLGMWRSETEAYCQAHGLTYTNDPSNADPVYFRNRLRHALIPELEKYNPRFKKSLLHTAVALQGDYSALQDVLEQVWKDTIIEVGEGYLAFDQGELEKIPPAMQRNLFRRAAGMLRPNTRDVGFDTLARAAGFIADPVGRVDLVGGLYLFAEGGRFYLSAWETDLPFAQFPQITENCSLITDHLALKDGWQFALDRLDGKTALEQARENANPFQAWLDADISAGKLEVRAPRRGDRFQPLGMDGQTVKLSDFFINVKLPKRARSKWPLICVGETIAWVAGYRIAHPFRVTAKTQHALRLTLDK